jgi:hypothetical protein
MDYNRARAQLTAELAAETTAMEVTHITFKPHHGSRAKVERIVGPL